MCCAKLENQFELEIQLKFSITNENEFVLESFDQTLISLCNRVTNQRIPKVACNYTSNGSRFECECALDFVLFVFQSLMWLKILAVDKWKLIRRVQFRFHCKSMFWYVSVCVCVSFLSPLFLSLRIKCAMWTIFLHLSVCVIACMYNVYIKNCRWSFTRRFVCFSSSVIILPLSWLILHWLQTINIAR